METIPARVSALLITVSRFEFADANQRERADFRLQTHPQTPETLIRRKAELRRLETRLETCGLEVRSEMVGLSGEFRSFNGILNCSHPPGIEALELLSRSL